MHSATFYRNAERRAHRRFPLHGAVELRASGIAVPIRAALEDISTGGCRLMSPVSLRLKHAVRIEFPRPGKTPVRINGHVVRKYPAAHAAHQYGIRFKTETDDERAQLRSYVSFYTRPAVAKSAETKLPVQAFVHGVGRFQLMMLTLKNGGMRVSSDRVLRQEWTVKIDLVVPGEARSERFLITVAARVLPGVRETRGAYVQELVFEDPSIAVRAEIDRLVAELSARST